MKIGWIGLGKMGLPMSQCIAAAGHAVSAYARNPAGAEKARAAGFASVPTLAALAKDAEVIVSAVSDDTALLDIVTGTDALGAHLSAGQTFIDTSTVSPEASATVAALLAARGVGYLRAPVSGSTATAKAAALTTVVSGSRAEYDRLLPLFESFTKTRFWLGEGEEARYMKLALNSTVAAMAALLSEAFVLARKGGVPLATTIEVFSKSAVATPLLDYKRAMILEDKYDPAFEVTQMLKDLDLALSAGRNEHAPLPIAAQVRQQFETALREGEGERDYFVIVRDAARRAGL